MARYIDADKLIAHLKDEIKACEPKFYGRVNGKSVAYGTELGLKSAISFAETLSTEDVVPKSEVEKLKADVEVWKQNRFNIYQKLECYKMTRAKVAREIFEEIEKHLIFNAYGIATISDKTFAELKKKYTEDKNGT